MRGKRARQIRSIVSMNTIGWPMAAYHMVTNKRFIIHPKTGERLDYNVYTMKLIDKCTRKAYKKAKRMYKRREWVPVTYSG